MMLRADHIQSVSEFKANYTKTLERLNTTGEAEVLTQNGEAKAVLLSPKVFDQLMQDADMYRQATMIRQSIEQHERGEYRDGFAALEDMKQKLRGRDGA